MPFSPDETIWTDFLNAWPIERLSKMTLAEYSTRGDKDCFVYWMESRLEDFGSIWGGSAFKFGIYSRRSTTQETAKAGRTYDEQYGWYTKYGSDRTKAFDVVRRNVVAVAEAARDGRLEAIDDVDLGDTYKWKIAFHYQSRETPSIVCIFSPKALAFQAGLPRVDRRIPLSEMYRRVSAGHEPSVSIVAWSARLWQDWSTKNPLAITLSAAVLRQGLLKINLGSSPFPEAMVGGESPDELGDLAPLCQYE